MVTGVLSATAQIYGEEKVYCVQPDTGVCAHVYASNCTGVSSWKTRSNCCDEQSTLKDRCLCGKNKFDYGCLGYTPVHSKCYGKYGVNATSCPSVMMLYKAVCVPRELPTHLCATVDNVDSCVDTTNYKPDTSLSSCCLKYSKDYRNYTISKGMSINYACTISYKYNYEI